MSGLEQGAFDEFVRARYAELLRSARALTGNEEDGADLLHDALASTLLAWDRLESKGDPEGFVRRTMVNRNISVWRRRTRERTRTPLASEPAPPTDQDRTLVVWAAVRRLPPRQRTVIALRFYEGLPVAEVAALMGSSQGTVKSQTSKALEKLRQNLDADGLGREVAGGPAHE